MLIIERGAFCESSLSWIDQNWIKSTILSITSFWGGFKEWKLEEFQRIHWVILSTGSEYSKNWRIAEIEEVSWSIIRFYVMIGWWWWFNVKFYYLSYILGWKEGARMESSTLSWYWRIVSSSWRFIPPSTFGSCSYLWKSLLLLCPPRCRWTLVTHCLCSFQTFTIAVAGFWRWSYTRMAPSPKPATNTSPSTWSEVREVMQDPDRAGISCESQSLNIDVSRLR